MSAILADISTLLDRPCAWVGCDREAVVGTPRERFIFCWFHERLAKDEAAR